MSTIMKSSDTHDTRANNSKKFTLANSKFDQYDVIHLK